MYLASSDSLREADHLSIYPRTDKISDLRLRLGGRGQDKRATDDWDRFYGYRLSLRTISDLALFTDIEYSCFFCVFGALR